MLLIILLSGCFIFGWPHVKAQAPITPQVAAATAPVEPEPEPEEEEEAEPVAPVAAAPVAAAVATEADSGSNPTSQPEVISESEVADLEAELDNLDVDSVPEDDDDESVDFDEFDD